MKKYQNYLFDFYGTLVDIETDEESLDFWTKVSQAMANFGASYPALELKTTYLQLVADLENKLTKSSPYTHVEIDLVPVFVGLLQQGGHSGGKVQVLEDARALGKTFRRLSLRRLQAYPNTLQTLATLKKAGKGIYLLSNAQAIFTEDEILSTGCQPYLDGIYLSSDYGVKKPDPAFYRLLMKDLDLDPSQTVMVGNDATTDMAGAYAAGIDGILLDTFPYIQEDLAKHQAIYPDMRVITDISQLLE